MAIVEDGVGLAAHLNHYWEMVNPEKQDHQKALLIVGKFIPTQINFDSCRSTRHSGCIDVTASDS